MHCWHLIIYFFPGQLVKAMPKNTFLKKAHFSGLNVIGNLRLRFDIINDNNSSCLRSFKAAMDAIKETKYATAIWIFEGGWGGHCKKTQFAQIYVWGPLHQRSWGTLKSCTEATRRRSFITFVTDLRKMIFSQGSVSYEWMEDASLPTGWKIKKGINCTYYLRWLLRIEKITCL